MSVFGRQGVDCNRAAAKKHHIDIQSILLIQAGFACEPESRQIWPGGTEGEHGTIELLPECRYGRESYVKKQKQLNVYLLHVLASLAFVTVKSNPPSFFKRAPRKT